jgi:hypothetical protein
MINSQATNAVSTRFEPGRNSSESSISVFPSSGRITLSGHSQNEWTKALGGKFDKLTALRLGWDGYAGQPVSFTCASFAARLLERLYDEALPPPSLVPGSDGTLQFEWHINQYDVEVDVLGAFEVVAIRHDCLTGATEELELDTDFTSLADWIGAMREVRFPQQADVAA